MSLLPTPPPSPPAPWAPVGFKPIIPVAGVVVASGVPPKPPDDYSGLITNASGNARRGAQNTLAAIHALAATMRGH